ncbi:MAG: PilN domain-containing protein [Candidatus Humimicrobiaceae bacterium]
MKDINLFQKKVKPKSKASLLLNIAIIVLLTALALICVLAFLLSNSKTNLSSKLNNLESVNLELKAYNDKLQAYKNFEDNVKYKAGLIESIKTKDVIWSEKFYEISKMIPDGVYLNSFDGTTDNLYNAIEMAKSGTEPENTKLIAFIINGNASDYIEISKLLIGLKDIPEITDPWVVSINENIVNNMKLLNFNIEAYWNLPLFLKDIKIVKPQQQTTNTEQNTSLDLSNNR